MIADNCREIPMKIKKTKTRYEVLVFATASNLETAVMEKLADGWALVGGVAYNAYSDQDGFREIETYAQAMTKQEKI